MRSPHPVEKHKHCKNDCVSHSSFACSLRKYSLVASSTDQILPLHHRVDRGKQNKITSKLIDRVKPFQEVSEPSQPVSNPDANRLNIKFKNSKQEQIESVIMSRLEVKQKKNYQPQELPREKGDNRNEHNKKQIQPSQCSLKVQADQLDESEKKQLVKVRSEELKQLKFNVGRIQKIIEMFNEKIYKNSVTNNLGKQADQFKERPQITSEFMSSNGQEDGVSSLMEKSKQNPLELSPLIRGIEIQESSRVLRQRVEGTSNQISSYERSAIEKEGDKQETNSELQLNYKMFKNWSTKSRSMASSRKRSQVAQDT